MAYSERVLILTLAKDAARHVGTYLRGIHSLTYPRQLLSLAVLEGDSTDGTYELFARHLPELNGALRSAELHKKDFGYHLPPGLPRYAHHLQMQRRSVLAKSRNHLLFRALDDEDW